MSYTTLIVFVLLNKNNYILKFIFFYIKLRKEGLIFDSILFNPLLTIITFIITVAIVFSKLFKRKNSKSKT